MLGCGQQLGHHKQDLEKYIMKDLDKKNIAESWIKMHHAREDSSDYKDNFWAYSRLSDLCEDKPENCFEIIELIRSIDGSDVILSNLAAGPFEDLLSIHGELFIERIEILSGTDVQLRKLLGAIWKNSIPDVIWKKVQSVSTPSW